MCFTCRKVSQVELRDLCWNQESNHLGPGGVQGEYSKVPMQRISIKGAKAINPIMSSVAKLTLWFVSWDLETVCSKLRSTGMRHSSIPWTALVSTSPLASAHLRLFSIMSLRCRRSIYLEKYSSPHQQDFSKKLSMHAYISLNQVAQSISSLPWVTPCCTNHLEVYVFPLPSAVLPPLLQQLQRSHGSAGEHEVPLLR